MASTGFTETFMDTSNCGAQVAQNIGSIVNYFNGRPETPPSPSSFVPFPRGPHFVARETLLDQIEKCLTHASWTALVGLGGVGKSQLAIEYSYQLSDQSPDRWIFWIHASNAARFEQSYHDFADLVKIPDRKIPQVNIFRLVYNWLRDKKNGKWLLILDNVDDANFLFETRPPDQTNQPSGDYGGRLEPLVAYLPRTSNGSILITTRTKGVALELVEESNIITVEPMDKMQAQVLFEKKLGKQGESRDIAELVDALGCIPLAIVQAAEYICQRSSRCSVRQYLDKFQKSNKEKAKLLNHEGGRVRRDWEAKNSIITSWQISFDHIRQTKPSAADLLSLMSFFDPQQIPEGLLQKRLAMNSRSEKGERLGRDEDYTEDDDDDDEGPPRSAGDDEFEEDVLTLRNYSFISANVDAMTFDMPSLVQLATQTWLEAHGQLERWKQQYIKNLCNEFPAGKYENWVTCQALFPHAKAAAAQQPKRDSALCEWASLLYHAAWYAWARGNAADAEMMSIKAMTARKKVLGPEHEESLNSMEMVGLAYELNGRWKEAEKLQAQVMETRTRALGTEHPSTLNSMANLALTYRNQGRLKEAEELGFQVMETSKRVLGTEHPSTLTDMANLASTYRNQGRWKEAEELGVQVMKTREMVLGTEHPETLTSISDLASTYDNHGRWKRAEELEVQVIETISRVLGMEHPDTLTSMGNLASTYMNQGRWKDAEELEMKVVEMSLRVLGTEHPGTLTSMGDLAVTYVNQGRLREAEELEVRVIEMSSRVLGTEHPGTLTGMANLAAVYRDQGRLKEAEELVVQVIETTSRVLGTEHPGTLSSMGILASTYRKQGQWKEAEELGVQVMETRKRVLGTEHSDTLESMKNLALTWKGQGKGVEGLRLMEECVRVRSKVSGVDHPVTRSSTTTLIQWRVEVPNIGTSVSENGGTAEVGMKGDTVK